MSGIAGIADLRGLQAIPNEALQRMSAVIDYRGPDNEVSFFERGIGMILGSLKLSHTEDAQSSLNGEYGTIAFVDGALYNSSELRIELSRIGRPAVPSNSGKLVSLLWEQYGGGMFSKLRGQFSIVIWDSPHRRLILGRDRFGICPLHWTLQGDWFLFASEIKALLSSKMVEARADLRGLNHVFTCFGVAGPRTCFEGISSIVPGQWLEICLDNSSQHARIIEHSYWQMDFPLAGEELSIKESQLIDQYEDLLTRSIDRRLQADEPVIVYSSGGLDSSMLVAMASRLRPEKLKTITFSIDDDSMHESSKAAVLAEYMGSQTKNLNIRGSDLIDSFPQLVYAAESPVIDASAAALFRMAKAVASDGFKVAISGEGADEWQAGYPWFRIYRQLNYFNKLPGMPDNVFRAYLKLIHSFNFPWPLAIKYQQAVGGDNAWLLAYVLMSAWKLKLFSPWLREELNDHVPFEDLQLNLPQMSQWHPFNRSIHIGARIHLAGLHFHARGDRSAMHSSVQTRYPFMDEDFVDFLAQLHPDWKLHGMVDKYLQRRVADRWLPKGFSNERKGLLHAPLNAFHQASLPNFAEQLLSEESLRKTGYFDPVSVNLWRKRVHRMRHGLRRLFIEMCLIGVFTTQLWHHIYLDSTLAELPGTQPFPD